MTPTRWQHVQDLVNATLELPQTERASFLQDVCRNNPELQQQIEGLVESYEEAGSFIEEAVEAGAQEAVRKTSLGEGDRIGPYEITEEIGQGGMGTVYCARRIDDQFRHQVAIKVIREGFGPEILARFRVERQILASLTHPNIARLLDGGITAWGLPYLVMEYIQGATIDFFAERRNSTIRERLELFQSVCAAMQYAHQNLIVHRDIKPANVMVTEDGTPKLLDFGIAKLLSPDALGQTIAATRPAERLMTPEYASPEQIRGEAITTATDVYGLGALLYELLAGKRPFRTANLSAASIERLICETGPERPSVARGGARTKGGETIPKDLDNIVLKAMHKDPVCRYSSPADLSNDVSRYLRGFPVTARRDSWTYKTRKFISRNKLGTAAAALFVITTTVLSIGMAVQASRAKQQAQMADHVSRFLGSLFENLRPDQAQGRVLSARDILDIGAKRVPMELAREPLAEARLLNILGTTYHELGVLDLSESLLTKAYEIERRVLGTDSLDAAGSLETLAEVASDRGELDRANADLELALAIFIRNKGRDSAEVAKVLNDMGELRWTMGDLKRAKEEFLQAIAISRQVNGPKDVQTLNPVNDLAAVLADQGDYTAAESSARDALATEMRVMGPNAPIVALSLSNLSFVLGQTARFPEAEATLTRALALRRKVDGAEHPAIALSLSDMGGLERELGHYQQAEALGKQALAMATKLEGVRSLDTTACQGQLGLTMLANGNLSQARQLLEASLATRLALGNPNNPELGDNYDRVGLLELASKNLTAARADFELGLAIRERSYGHENDNVASSLNHLGEVLAAQGNYTAAKEEFRKGIRIASLKFKGPHTITAEGLFGLGTTLLSEGRMGEAKSPLAEALAMRQRLLPAQHPDVLRSAAAVARCGELMARNKPFSQVRKD